MSNFDFNNIPDSVYHDAVVKAFSSCLLERRGNEYSFRCPACGDSKVNKYKKRGYVYFNNSKPWTFCCFNCPRSCLLTTFLKEYYNDIYKELILHAYINPPNGSKEKEPEKTIVEKSYRPVSGISHFKKDELVSIFDNNYLSKIALELVISRKIRKDVYSKWYVCLKDSKFYDRDEQGNVKLNERGNPIGNEYGYRLIIPYYRYGGFWSQFDARDIHKDSNLRYRNLSGIEKEFYNIDWLDVKKPFFMLEGSIDSGFIRNAISFGGTEGLNRLLKTHPEILENKENGTFIWDNDDAGRDSLEKTIELGFKWMNWKYIEVSEQFKLKEDGTERKLKDINDAILYSNAFTQDSSEYITLDSLNKFIEKPSLIKSILEFGNRKKLKIEKNKEFFNKKPDNFKLSCF